MERIVMVKWHTSRVPMVDRTRKYRYQPIVTPIKVET